MHVVRTEESLAGRTRITLSLCCVDGVPACSVFIVNKARLLETLHEKISRLLIGSGELARMADWRATFRDISRVLLPATIFAFE